MCADTTKCAHFVVGKGFYDWKYVLERLRRRHEQSMKHVDTTIMFSRRSQITWKNWYGVSLLNKSIRTTLEIASATFGFFHKIYCWSRIGV